MTTTKEIMVSNAITMDTWVRVTIVLLLIGGIIYFTKNKTKGKNKKISTKNTNPLPYGKYKLLLIIPANRLTPDLKIGLISNNEVNVLIRDAIRAYCFAVDDEKGNQVMQNVECFDSPIDYKTENRIFLQLELSAEFDIVTEHDNLGIRSKIESGSDGKLLKIQALKKARSTSDFYLI